MIALALRVLRDYGRLLANLEPGACALPRSLLPHPPATINEASRRALKVIGDSDPALRDALIRGHVFLAQFVDDALAARVRDGQVLLDRSGPVDGVLVLPPPAALEALAEIQRIKAHMAERLAEACELAGLELALAPAVLPEDRAR